MEAQGCTVLPRPASTAAMTMDSESTSSTRCGVKRACEKAVSSVLRRPCRPVGRISDSPARSASARSEEHTSELQSQSNLVCRLLLEKKKKRGANDRPQVADLGQRAP